MLRLSCKTLSQSRILRCDSNGTGVVVAGSHHHTTQSNQRRRCKSELLCTQDRGQHNVTARSQLAIDFQTHFLTQPIFQECFVCLAQSQFPGSSRMMNARKWRCSRATFMTTDHDGVCSCFSNPCSNGPHSCDRHELHADPGPRVGTPQIKNELSQIFDGVNVMMGRRGVATI